ncbi:MAG TPA: TadE/TadG family type IV pilus assembly protein [Devosia sp.]
MLSPAIRRARQLGRDEQGATAVEFALLALPFFVLIFAILETAMTFFAQQVLESALQDASRFIRTGQSQTSWNEAAFRQAICDRGYGFIQCDGNRLWIKVAPATDFAAAATQIQKPVADECTVLADPAACDWSLAQAYDDGVGSDVIIAQAFYKWPTLINVPWFNLANQAGGNRLLSAVRVFKNEPF